MSKARLTMFLCTGKNCSRVWKHLCGGSPRKWLKRQLEEAGLPIKLNVVETECQDRCEHAACLCAVHGPHASHETGIRSPHDADRLLAAFRACCEPAPANGER